MTKVSKKSQTKQSCKTNVMPSAFVLKKCTCCNLEFPKTEDYFYAKVIKQQNKSGLAIYHSFRAICKRCHNKKNEANRIRKRCKEMNCDVSDYRENWKKQYSETRSIDADAKKLLTEGSYGYYLKLKREGKIEDYQSFFKRVEISKKERNERLRNEVLSKQKYFSKADLKKAKRRYQRKNVENLTNATVANNYLGMSVKDVPIEIIEFKRLTIQLKRELENLKTI